ncbi:hypothetical protein DFH06DRAFT_1327533 [Mycena polygramma]|nr:hypothetical protein DFH06DRAFT_1327533 [Mycena polygramma]
MTSPRESTYTDLKQEEFDPYRLDEKSVPRQNLRLVKPTLGSRLLGWPALVVLGQLCLQALGWGFLAAVRSRGTLPLPLATAVSVDDNPHIVTFVATLISTFLAASSSFLFSYALRRSMSLYLLRPVSLDALGAGVNISMRSFVFHRRHWKWPAVSLLCLIMAGIQTSAWSTLITPVDIVISTPLIGRDIDLSSAALQQFWKDTESTVSESCIAAEAKQWPEVFQTAGFNVSTRGILAATLNDTDVGGWHIPATVESAGPRHYGISNSYSMDQQGFTANVSCELQQLTNLTTPAIESLMGFSTSWGGPDAEEMKLDGLNPNVTFLSIASSCYAAYQLNVSEVLYFAGGGSYLWSLSCDPTPDVPNNYTLILQDNMNLTTPDDTSYLVCQIAPTTSTVHVNYASEISANVETVGPPLMHAGGPAGFFGMLMISDVVFDEQSSFGNGMANQVLELASNGGGDKQVEILEQYLQGVIEYSASVLRACLHNSSVFPDGVPTNITQPMSGTWNTRTVGWKRYSTGTTIWILTPGLFMACSTVALVLVALYRHGDEMQLHTTTFDPSNPLHLMAAAAAGGLNNVFRSLRARDIHEGGKTTVVLGSVPGRGPALVRADEYAPLSSVSPLASS